MKTLSSSNKTRLKQYTAVAGALVAQGNINAQVVATNLNPDVVVDSLSGPYALDFNNDANPELAFFVQHISGASSTQGVQFTYEGAAAGAQLSPGVSLLGATGTGSSSSSFQVSALNNGDPISAAANFGTSSNAALGLDLLVDAGILGQIPVQQGNFLNQSNKFLGAKLTAGANTYYGWVELSVNTNASQITIHGFGYQSTANSQILAGEGANSGLELIALADKVTIVGTPEHVSINVTPDVIGAKVSFVSMSGQEVSSALLTDINNTISFETLSTGIYQVVVSTATEKTTQRVYVK
ncbi:MAG: T9SS type A sorting domain-containing protein [Flavobacteriia bacterium]